jgi:aspartokinase
MGVALIIQKYGGSSLATPEHIRKAAERISKIKSEGHNVVAVVSAMGRMTDHLISLAHKTVTSPTKRELDMLLTAGERVSMSLLSMVLQSKGIPAISFTGSQSGIITTSEHTEAKIIDIKPLRIQKELELGKVVIVAGFQGVSSEKEITTLGRGGSDTTAVALAAALKAEECHILTDVDGLYSANPRIVQTSKLISNLDYDIAIEMAELGAKMHPRSVALAKEQNVRVRISNSQNDRFGTLLSNKFAYDGMKDMEKAGIISIATQEGYSYLKHSNHAITIAPKNELTHPEAEDISIVSLVGSKKDLLKEVLSLLNENDVEYLNITQKSLSLSIAVYAKDQNRLANLLHSWFIV